MKKSILTVLALSSLSLALAHAEDLPSYAANIRQVLTQASTEGVAGADCRVLFTDGPTGVFSVSIQKVSDSRILATFAPSAEKYGSHSTRFSAFGSRFSIELDDNGYEQSLNHKKNTITITTSDAEAQCKIH